MEPFSHNAQSALTSNMKQDVRPLDVFPVLIGNEVAHFHDVAGGYNRQRSFDVVNFVHRVQGPGSPYRVNPEQASHAVEAHLEDHYYDLGVDSVRVRDEYPERDYVLSLRVDDYRYGEHSFHEALTANIDERETRYEPN